MLGVQRRGSAASRPFLSLSSSGCDEIRGRSEFPSLVLFPREQLRLRAVAGYGMALHNGDTMGATHTGAERAGNEAPASARLRELGAGSLIFLAVHILFVSAAVMLFAAS
jgi:hypothetical protein